MTLHTTLPINRDFAAMADDERIETTVKSLRNNGIAAYVADDGQQAKERAFEILPDGAEVFTATSRTLETIGFDEDLSNSDTLSSVRSELAEMDPEEQEREMVAMGAAPEWVVGSVHAVTEKGEVLVASATGSQIGPYSAGAERVMWIVGAQKLVGDIGDAYRRIYEYALPLEDARARQAYGSGSQVGKMLTVYKEKPGRITMIIVKEPLGF